MVSWPNMPDGILIQQHISYGLNPHKNLHGNMNFTQGGGETGE